VTSLFMFFQRLRHRSVPVMNNLRQQPEGEHHTTLLTLKERNKHLMWKACH